MISIDKYIDGFHKLVLKGVESWKQAGSMLLSMEKDNPDAAQIIINKGLPFLDKDRLDMFRRIGTGELNPLLLADPSPIAARLSAMAREHQDTALEGGIPVARIIGGEEVVHLIPYKQVTRNEGDLALTDVGFRSIPKQFEILKGAPAKKNKKTDSPRFFIDKTEGTIEFGSKDKVKFTFAQFDAIIEMFEAAKGEVEAKSKQGLQGILQTNQITAHWVDTTQQHHIAARHPLSK